MQAWSAMIRSLVRGAPCRRHPIGGRTENTPSEAARRKVEIHIVLDIVHVL
jgi:hypothetical protein